MKSSDNIYFDIVLNADNIKRKMKYASQFVELLACGDKKFLADLKIFINRWHGDEIPGDKITISLFDKGDDRADIIGVVRFWKSPYCNGKWLIEGLEVLKSKRNQGYGKMLVSRGIEELRNLKVSCVYVNISKNNKVSIALHKSLGFKKECEGCENSFGEKRENSNQYKLTLS